MTKKEIEEKWQKLYKDFVLAKNKYTKYVEQFITNTVNGEITREATKSLNRGTLEESIKLREEMDRTAKEFWDFACSVTFPK